MVRLLSNMKPFHCNRCYKPHDENPPSVIYIDSTFPEVTDHNTESNSNSVATNQIGNAVATAAKRTTQMFALIIPTKRKTRKEPKEKKPPKGFLAFAAEVASENMSTAIEVASENMSTAIEVASLNMSTAMERSVSRICSTLMWATLVIVCMQCSVAYESRLGELQVLGFLIVIIASYKHMHDILV